MSWVQIEADDKHRVPLLVLRCRNCRRLAVMTNPFSKPSKCCCQEKR